jgi:hypothetical protein
MRLARHADRGMVLPVLLVLALLSPAPDAAWASIAAAQPDPAGGARLPFAPEETMEFKIDYLGMKAGVARISVGRLEGTILPVFLEARTAGIGAIVDFRHQLASYLDSGTGLPRSSSSVSIEPRYRRTVVTRFDPAAGKAIVRTQGRTERVDELPVPPETLDFVALVFKLRAIPLAPGDRIPFDVLSGNRLSHVVAEVEARDTISTWDGDRSALRVRVPTGFTGKFGEKNPTILWLSDDPRRVVLRISTEFAIGRAVAQLVSYQEGRPTP